MQTVHVVILVLYLATMLGVALVAGSMLTRPDENRQRAVDEATQDIKGAAGGTTR